MFICNKLSNRNRNPCFLIYYYGLLDLDTQFYLSYIIHTLIIYVSCFRRLWSTCSSNYESNWQNCEETGVVTNIKRPVHHRFTRSAEDIAVVSESVAENTNVSIPRHPQELWLSYGTLWRILHLDLHLHRYTKFSSHNNWNQLTIHNVLDTWNGCLNNRRWTDIFRTKFSSAMKYIPHSVAMLINKIVVFGVLRMLK